MKKKSFASLTNNFWSFKKRIKKIFINGAKLVFFFIRNLRALHLLFAGTYIRIWGHLYSACIALQLYSALRFERLKRVQKSRAIPWEFWDEVFSFKIWGHFIQQCISNVTMIKKIGLKLGMTFLVCFKMTFLFHVSQTVRILWPIFYGVTDIFCK